MAHANPAAADLLNSPDHSKGHRVYDWDTGAADDSVVVGADNTCTFLAMPVTPSAAPDADYEVSNKKYVDDTILGYDHMHNGVSSYNLATASAVQNIAHGMGLIPRYVQIRTIGPANNGTGSESLGSYNGTTNACIYWCQGGGGAGTWESGNSAAFGVKAYTAGDTSQYQTAVITVDATNIILTWTRTGAATGTTNILWETWK